MSLTRFALALASVHALACAAAPAPAGGPASGAQPMTSALAPSSGPPADGHAASSASPPHPGTDSAPTPRSQAPMQGPGCPRAVPERPVAPPDRAIFGKCAYYTGCPKAALAQPIPDCPPNLEVITVRQLRSEGGRRNEGTPLAIRGRAQWQPRLRGIIGLAEPGTVHVGPRPCEVGPAVLYLATDDPGPCLFAGAHLTTTAGALGCQGDATDRCCRANPGFPVLDGVVVAVGRYGGTGGLPGGDRFDLFFLESYCYPAADGSAPGAQP